MRLGDTPVPIPNTMVKTCAADGTMLETAWESRWLLDIAIFYKNRDGKKLQTISCFRRKHDGKKPQTQCDFLRGISHDHVPNKYRRCSLIQNYSGLIAQPVRAHA